MLTVSNNLLQWYMDSIVNKASQLQFDAAHSHGSIEIDAVILWVDGDDAAHRAKRMQFLEKADAHLEAVRETRFRSVGEINYCVMSILQFAPFIRTIHVVTDAQVPPIFKRLKELPVAWQSRLNLVDHKQLFEGNEKYLPTFNSRAIETLMYRIPGLAENFLAFNDDFILIRPTKLEDFFSSGRPIYRGQWSKRSLFRELKRRLGQGVRNKLGIHRTLLPSNSLAQLKAAELVGYQGGYFRMDHTPKPMQKTPLEVFFNEHPHLLAKNISYRVRDASQFHPPSLSCHLAFKSGLAIHEESLSLLYVKPGELSDDDIEEALASAEGDPSIKFACFQSLDEASPKNAERILKWLDASLLQCSDFGDELSGISKLS